VLWELNYLLLFAKVKHKYNKSAPFLVSRLTKAQVKCTYILILLCELCQQINVLCLFDL